MFDDISQLATTNLQKGERRGKVVTSPFVNSGPFRIRLGMEGSGRLRLAHIAVCLWLLNSTRFTHAQQQTSANENPEVAVPCPFAPSHDEHSSDPEISISDVTLSGFIQMPVSDQQEIVASIKEQKYAIPLDGVVEVALEKARTGCQNYGYFKVEVNGEAKTLPTSAASTQIALFVHVDENAQ